MKNDVPSIRARRAHSSPSRTATRPPGAHLARSTWPSTITLTGTSTVRVVDLHEMAAPEHHRAGVQRVRRDERDDEGVRAPRHHRAAGREVVRRGAGRAWPGSAPSQPSSPIGAPSTNHRRITIRPGVALDRTMSLTPTRLAVRCGQRRQVDAPRSRRSDARSPPRPRDARRSTLVRNPTRPKLTPRHGTEVPRNRWSARSVVPSPPSTTASSASTSSTISAP